MVKPRTASARSSTSPSPAASSGRAVAPPLPGYEGLLERASAYLDDARRLAARRVNAVMTATHWLMGRLILEEEQRGSARAEYGAQLLERLAADLTRRHGRGFSVQNLRNCRAFFRTWKIRQTASGELAVEDLAPQFPLPWSHYVRLLSVENPRERRFYEEEALRAGWTARQLDRQIVTRFYDRALAAKTRAERAALVGRHQKPRPHEATTVEEELKDPYVLEFLGLKDEYSENELEDALIHHLESFLLELGDDWTFVARQKRLLVDAEWFRVDLVFFHRRLRALVLIDLKADKFSHADVGQMNLYVNYAREHWTRPGENPPIGVILSAGQTEGKVRYALEGLQNKILAASYLRDLPSEKHWVEVIERAKRLLEARRRT